MVLPKMIQVFKKFYTILDKKRFLLLPACVKILTDVIAQAMGLNELVDDFSI